MASPQRKMVTQEYLEQRHGWQAIAGGSHILCAFMGLLSLSVTELCHTYNM